MGIYADFRKRYSDKRNSLFAIAPWTDKSVSDGIKRLGVSEDDIIPVGFGYYILSSDEDKWNMLYDVRKRDFILLLEDDNFVYDMFLTSMHEVNFSVKEDMLRVLNYCELSYDDLKNSERLKTLYKKAFSDYLKGA